MKIFLLKIAVGIYVLVMASAASMAGYVIVMTADMGTGLALALVTAFLLGALPTSINVLIETMR